MNIEKLLNIFAWISFVCGLIAIICLTAAAMFNSYILASITIVMLAICLLDFFCGIWAYTMGHDALVDNSGTDKGKKVIPETCDHCKHLYFSSDGSTDCDSPYARACLMGNKRMFKEE